MLCENDYNLIASWFRGVDLNAAIATPVTVRIAPGNYASAHWGPPIDLVPGNGSNLTVVRYLLVSEVTEMFKLAQNKGWFGTGNEGSAGEGLSRFLAQKFLVANGLGTEEPGFALAGQWLNSTREDYVNHIDLGDHGIDAKTGCAILFLYYLSTELGFTPEQIVAAAAPELAGVYRNLTRDARDPFPRFKAMLDAAYPPGQPANIPGPNPDDPYPLTPRPVGRDRLAQRTGDFDGDGTDEILVSSPWGIGILKQAGDMMVPLMMASNGTRFAGWLLNTADNRFGPIGDFDGDGHDEILVTSPWGIGILKYQGGTLTALAMCANGTHVGGWQLNTATDNFALAGDFDGDRIDELFVTSPGGIAMFKTMPFNLPFLPPLVVLTAPMVARNGARFGGWLLNTNDNAFANVADYNGDGRDELFVSSPWGIGLLELAGGTLNAPFMVPNGTRLGDWLLETGVNEFGPAADFDQRRPPPSCSSPAPGASACSSSSTAA